jgi:hypothetical protein
MRAFASFTPRFQILDILGEYPAPWDSEWYYHPYPYFSIEWLDVDPVGHEPEVIEALQRYGVPFSREGAFLRVWGYYDPGHPPAFVL